MRENVIKLAKKLAPVTFEQAFHLWPAFFLLWAVIATLSSGQWVAKALITPNPNLPNGNVVSDVNEDDTSQKDTTQEEKENDPFDITSYADGKYYGSGQGYAGKIDVEVTIKDEKLVSINIVKVEADGDSFIKKAKGVIDTMIQTQSLDVDVVSGATFSSNGIIEAVKNALTGNESSSSNSNQQEEPASVDSYNPPENGYKDGTYYGTGAGFGGNITVKLVIQDGKIAEIEVTDAPGEGAEYLTKAKTLIPKMISQQTPKVDAISGATYSSNGIMAAAQNALSQAALGDPKQTESETESKNKKDTKSSDTKKKYKDGSYYGTGKGFAGDITVKVTIKKSSISKIKVTKVESDGADFIKKAKGVISKIIKAQSTDVDMISGATYSSNGIIEGVQKALKQALTDQTGPSEKGDDTKETDDTNQPDPNKNQAGKYTDGIYIGSATGFGGSIEVKVVVTGGKIVSITIVNAQSETKEFLEKAKGVIAFILQKQNTSVDVISGATYTSQGIINAVENALKENTNSSDEPNPDDQTQEPSEDDTNTGKYKNGTYIGRGTGFKGIDSVKATVIISGGKITKITIESTDTKSYLDWALDIIYDILVEQTPEGVDVISGATFTSDGILEAVEKALEGALNE